MYMAGNTLHQSLDSGKTFQPLYSYSYGDHEVPHADIRSCLIRSWSNDGTQDEIYLGTDGGLSYSKNSGQTFTNMNGHFLPLTQFYGLGISPFSSAISAGSQDNSIFTYLPKQQQWIYNNHGDGYDVEYNMRYPMEAYGQYNYLTLFKTTNDVAAFNEPLRNDMFRDGSNKKTLQAYPNGDLYFAERDLYHYHRSTQQWDKYPLPTPHQALAFEVAPSDSSVIYVSSLWSGLYKSTDGGKSFQNITASLVVNGYNLGGTRFHAICVHPKNPKELWLGLGYLGDYFDNCRQSIRVIHSMDGGATWTDYSMGLPVYSVSDLVFLEGTQQGLFAATLEGIYFREDSTRSWGLYSTNFPKCVVPEMKIDYCRGKLVAATYGRGLWETKLPSCDYNAPLKIAGTTLWRLDDTLAALPILTDVDLGRKGKLRIACPVYMADGKRILYKGSLKNRVQFEGRGSILNGCGGQWGGIQKKK
jgi:hypothetical protein